jgi:DNA invertase Pin-like site-specific DNA recombinase
MEVLGVVRENDDLLETQEKIRTSAESAGMDYGGTFVRRGLERESLLDLVEMARHKSILLNDLSTLSDSPRETVVRLLLLETADISIAVMGKFQEDVLELALAEATKKKRPSEKIISGMQARALRGLALGRLPYGYIKGPEGQPSVESTEEKTVRLIFELCIGGKGIRAIVSELNDRGLRTRRGGSWSMITVRDMLRSRFYIGTYDRLGMRVSGNHTGIVSRDDFDQTQARLNAGAAKSGYKKGEPYLLSGLLICGSCGGKMIGVKRRQGWKRKDGTKMTKAYQYYQCGSRTNQSRCGYHSRQASEIESEVINQLEHDGIQLGQFDSSNVNDSFEFSDRIERIVKKAISAGETASSVRDQFKILLDLESTIKSKTRRHLSKYVQRIVVKDDGLAIEKR